MGWKLLWATLTWLCKVLGSGFVCRMVHPYFLTIEDLVGKLMGVAKRVKDLMQEYNYIDDPK